MISATGSSQKRCMDVSDFSAFPDAWVMGMWLRCGAGTFTQCHSTASGCVGESWHRFSATAPAARQWSTAVSSRSLFVSVGAASQSSMKILIPVPFISMHLPPHSSLSPVSRVPQRFSWLQDSVLLTFHLLSLTTILKHHFLFSLNWHQLLWETLHIFCHWVKHPFQLHLLFHSFPSTDFPMC